MPKYIVEGSDLTSVANAIRTAGGTSESLTFPSGFVSAIGNLGGSSDFSTAEVTVTNNSINSTVTLLIPNVVEGEDSYITNVAYFEDSSPLTLNVPIYKGFCFCVDPFSVDGPIVTFAVTGDITWNNVMGTLTITGNGTITIADSVSA